MITAVLIKYKRPKELEQIVEHLKTVPEITEVLIRDNRENNLFTYGRYLEAQKAKNEIIYTQDDDYLVYNIPCLIEAFGETQIINNIKRGYEKGYPCPETVVGWGALFCKSWINVFNRWKQKYGENYLMYRGGDRIFTTLFGEHKSIKVQTGREIYEFPSARDKKIAIYRRKDHKDTVDEIRSKLKGLT